MKCRRVVAVQTGGPSLRTPVLNGHTDFTVTGTQIVTEAWEAEWPWLTWTEDEPMDLGPPAVGSWALGGQDSHGGQRWRDLCPNSRGSRLPRLIWMFNQPVTKVLAEALMWRESLRRPTGHLGELTPLGPSAQKGRQFVLLVIMTNSGWCCSPCCTASANAAIWVLGLQAGNLTSSQRTAVKEGQGWARPWPSLDTLYTSRSICFRAEGALEWSAGVRPAPQLGGSTLQRCYLCAESEISGALGAHVGLGARGRVAPHLVPVALGEWCFLPFTTLGSAGLGVLGPQSEDNRPNCCQVFWTPSARGQQMAVMVLAAAVDHDQRGGRALGAQRGGVCVCLPVRWFAWDHLGRPRLTVTWEGTGVWVLPPISSQDLLKWWVRVGI